MPWPRSSFAIKGKVFSANDLFDVSRYIVAIQLVQRSGRNLRDERIIDDSFDCQGEISSNLMAETSSCALQCHFVASNVPAGPAGEFSDGDHCGFERGNFPAANRLEIHDNRGGGQYGVDSLMRHGTASGFSPDGYLKFVVSGK